MKLLVTGATGFIGGNLVRYLAEQGHSVVALVREGSDTSSLPDAVTPVTGDIRNLQSLHSAFESIDVVIHLAALFNHPELTADDYYAVNVQGTSNVLAAAKASGVSRVIHCSTVGVASGGPPPYSESSPYAPPEWDKYETTKAEGEKVAIAFSEREDYPVFIIRPAQVYGPGDLSKLKFYRMVKKGVLINPGRTLKHLIYIDDLCEAFLLACTAESGTAVPIIIAQAAPTALTDLVNVVASELGVDRPKIVLPAIPVTIAATIVENVFNAIGRKPPIFRRSMNFFTKSVWFQTENAERYLGFKASTPVDVGVKATADWYRQNGMI